MFLPSFQPLENRAAAVAHLAHWGVVNEKNDEPYIEHPRRVANYITSALIRLRQTGRVSLTGFADLGQGPGSDGKPSPSVYLRSLGWLHDTIEDTWVDPTMLTQIFGYEVSDDVRALSVNEYRSRERYLKAVAEVPRLLVVKFADLMDNGDPVRLGQISDLPTRARLVTKYAQTAQTLGVVEAYEEWGRSRIREAVIS